MRGSEGLRVALIVAGLPSTPPPEDAVTPLTEPVVLAGAATVLLAACAGALALVARRGGKVRRRADGQGTASA